VIGALLGLFVLLLLAATGLLIAFALRVRGTAALILAAYAVAFAEVVGLSLLLSPFEAMTRGGLIAGVVSVFTAAFATWVLLGAPRPPMRQRRLALPAHRGPLLVLGVVVALALSYVVALAIGTPPNGWDPLNYHLARAAFWVQSGHVGYIGDAYDQRLNYNPPNAEIGLAFVLAVTRDERFVGFVQLFAALACWVGVFTMARRFGLERQEAIFGALLFATLPIVLLQSSGAKNDIVVASFLLVAAVFIVRDKRRDMILAGLATALAVGTKFTAAYGLAILLALAVLAPARTWRAWRIAGIAFGAVAGSYWYAVNAHETGRFLGDQSNAGSLTAPFHPAANIVTAYGDALDALDLSGAQGTDILVYVAAAILVAAGLALFRSRSGNQWRGALLAGALVASPLLFLVLSDDLGRPGLLRLYDLVGKPQAYLATGDDVTSSPTTASDTASWFGPAGLLLAVGAGIATCVLLYRRSFPRQALIPTVAPFLWLALVAVTLTYNPWEGRFFIFPIALSATLWGCVLRVRPVAWAMTALAATTAILSLVHYVEKPSGLRLIEPSNTPSVWELARWQVQSQHDPPLAPVLRFLDEQIPQHDSIALALGPNNFGYPAFGPHLQRRVLLVPFGSSARDTRASWLFANPQRATEIDSACWHSVLASERGTIFSRKEQCRR
jgi:hypothetical protein